MVDDFIDLMLISSSITEELILKTLSDAKPARFESWG